MKLKSKRQLFEALDTFFNTTRYTEKQLDAVGNETYGPRSFIYVQSKTEQDRMKLENFLTQNGFKVMRDYWPGSSLSEIQVSYFRGWHWDE